MPGGWRGSSVDAMLVVPVERPECVFHYLYQAGHSCPFPQYRQRGPEAGDSQSWLICQHSCRFIERLCLRVKMQSEKDLALVSVSPHTCAHMRTQTRIRIHMYIQNEITKIKSVSWDYWIQSSASCIQVKFPMVGNVGLLCFSCTSPFPPTDGYLPHPYLQRPRADGQSSVQWLL